MVGWLLPTFPALAASERIPLTLSVLQERLNSPILSDGIPTVDLSYLVIDLTNENQEFRDQFYQQLQARLNRSSKPIGLNFSYSLIQGELISSKFGLPTSLSQGTLPPILTAIEQQQLEEDERFVSHSTDSPTAAIVLRGPLQLENTLITGKVDFSKTVFLQRLEATNATFTQEADWRDSRFGRTVNFKGATFGRDVNFSYSKFLAPARFHQTHFQGTCQFIGTTFKEEANFAQAEFNQFANFTRSSWQKTANFSQVNWRDRVLFSKSRFLHLVSFTNSTFEKSVAFRTTQFNEVVIFKDAKLVGQIDFSNAEFVANSELNVTGLAFDSDQAKIIGDTGKIGNVLSLSTLQGNETVVQNLIRNFRDLEQIPDANQVEYTTKQLKFKQLSRSIFKTSLKNILQLNWFSNLLHWILLSLLLLLSNYGTNFSLVIGVGIVTTVYFSALFWLVDCWRRRLPKPILPSRYDIIWMSASSVLIFCLGIIDIFQSSEQPTIALSCLSLILFPIPLLLVGKLYLQGRYHDLMDSSYFWQDGSMRQLRLLIVRLPVIPEFIFFRERYVPLVWERRWNWLNYYDFSLNNLIKLGFNDIRLRDCHLPGLISALVWYQWSLGILYVALLLWTVSRTIPGLNLLIYLK